MGRGTLTFAGRLRDNVAGIVDRAELNEEEAAFRRRHPRRMGGLVDSAISAVWVVDQVRVTYTKSISAEADRDRLCRELRKALERARHGSEQQVSFNQAQLGKLCAHIIANCRKAKLRRGPTIMYLSRYRRLKLSRMADGDFAPTDPRVGPENKRKWRMRTRIRQQQQVSRLKRKRVNVPLADGQ